MPITAQRCIGKCQPLRLRKRQPQGPFGLKPRDRLAHVMQPGQRRQPEGGRLSRQAKLLGQMLMSGDGFELEDRLGHRSHIQHMGQQGVTLLIAAFGPEDSGLRIEA